MSAKNMLNEQSTYFLGKNLESSRNFRSTNFIPAAGLLLLFRQIVARQSIKLKEGGRRMVAGHVLDVWSGLILQIES
jgi:hypothetical protein